MDRAERDVDRDRADDADRIEGGEAVEIVADEQHEDGHAAATTAGIQGTPKRLSFCMSGGSSPSRAMRYWTEIMSVMAVLAAESSSTPPMMRTAHSPQAPT